MYYSKDCFSFHTCETNALRTMEEILGTGINIKFSKSKLGHYTSDK